MVVLDFKDHHAINDVYPIVLLSGRVMKIIIVSIIAIGMLIFKIHEI